MVQWRYKVSVIHAHFHEYPSVLGLCHAMQFLHGIPIRVDERQEGVAPMSRPARGGLGLKVADDVAGV
ncbi:MAG: hypothetical protein A3D94_05200 [Alphaproteobacteria bacterium RIFCSPHIGHO2_12_FULL_66_14]|nr:MAG: hypothetical protein A3D94_05200 [Alphaproteobacteria bacterium RIFCSPHIGHO2_12_FULL_66_14]